MIQVPLILLRFESRVITGTVLDPNNNNTPMNLTTFHGGCNLLEFEVKTRPGVADPGILHKAIGSGVTILTQSGVTLGQFTITFNPADFTAVVAGIYWMDIVAGFTDGTRYYVYAPTQMRIKDVVNFL